MSASKEKIEIDGPVISELFEGGTVISQISFDEETLSANHTGRTGVVPEIESGEPQNDKLVQILNKSLLEGKVITPTTGISESNMPAALIAKAKLEKASQAEGPLTHEKLSSE